MIQAYRPALSVAIACFSFQLSSLAYAKSVEAKRDGVDVLSSPDKNAPVLQKLKKGESLPSKERKGMYWEVRLKNGKSGFVSILNVNHKAEENGISEAIRASIKEGRSTGEAEATRGRSAVMGVRGLDDNDTALAGNIRPNMRAVYGMEDIQISQKQLEAFSEEINKEIAQRAR